MSISDDSSVVAIAKTPMTRESVSALLPGELSVKDATNRLSGMQWGDEPRKRAARQLAREVNGQHDFFALTPEGTSKKVPATTPLKDLSVPQPARTGGKVEKLPTVSLEVVAYMRVGVGG